VSSGENEGNGGVACGDEQDPDVEEVSSEAVDQREGGGHADDDPVTIGVNVRPAWIGDRPSLALAVGVELMGGLALPAAPVLTPALQCRHIQFDPGLKRDRLTLAALGWLGGRVCQRRDAARERLS